MFDWRQLQRWKISEASLPEGSIIQFREPTVVAGVQVVRDRFIGGLYR
jgi:hypothetical protein